MNEEDNEEDNENESYYSNDLINSIFDEMVDIILDRYTNSFTGFTGFIGFTGFTGIRNISSFTENSSPNIFRSRTPSFTGLTTTYEREFNDDSDSELDIYRNIYSSRYNYYYDYLMSSDEEINRVLQQSLNEQPSLEAPLDFDTG